MSSSDSILLAEHEISLHETNLDAETNDSFLADSNFRRPSAAPSLSLITSPRLSACRGCSRKQRPFIALVTPVKME
jgi:hypothetical protein